MSAEELKFGSSENSEAFQPPTQKLKINSQRLTGFLCATLVLGICFSVPLYNLLRLALSDDLYSDIPLIPFISLYLLWMRRENLPHNFYTSVKPAVVFFAAGLLALGIYWFASHNGMTSVASYFALLLFFTGICFLFLGETFMRAAAFPAVLLLFTIPLPDILRHNLEAFLQYGSTTVAGVFFQLTSTPVFQDGLNFHFPNCTIEVAPECSGIHSTVVLLITSLAGGWLFLRSPWNRAVLALVIIPLALIRNGFRIFVIGRLCAAYGPQMLASPIHRHGGPLFFALSLIPFFLLLICLRKIERTKPVTKK
jgi:exosortase C (VPDSG-CTERM-specific)